MCVWRAHKHIIIAFAAIFKLTLIIMRVHGRASACLAASSKFHLHVGVIIPHRSRSDYEVAAGRGKNVCGVVRVHLIRSDSLQHSVPSTVQNDGATSPGLAAIIQEMPFVCGWDWAECIKTKVKDTCISLVSTYHIKYECSTNGERMARTHGKLVFYSACIMCF